MTPVLSLFERIGLGGGGKVKAVYQRMNALAEMDEMDPILLNLNHSLRQKLNFAALQAQGTLAPRVRTMTVPEACYAAALAAGVAPYSDFPETDRCEITGQKTLHFQNDTVVMTDKTKATSIGQMTIRSVPHKDGERVYALLDGVVHQLVQTNADGTTETTDFVKSLPVRWVKTKGRTFVIARNLITGKICRMPRVYDQNVFEMIDLQNSVVFFDGVTSAYLAPVTKGKRALFLHADHRGPDGAIVPRSKYLIENFKGDAIITSTEVHKAQIEQDVTPAAAVHVIPHYCETRDFGATERRDLVTVSRLELIGKPIHECIEAFCRIKDEFPCVNYLIYGVGSGHKRLADQITALGCEDRIRLAGYTNAPLEVFQKALVSVYPTTTEGFGLSILEALANGCPVISYDVNYGPREMIVSGKNGELVAHGDIEAIAAAMRRVLLNPQLYCNGTQHGLHRYRREAYLANYRGIVGKLLA